MFHILNKLAKVTIFAVVMGVLSGLGWYAYLKREWWYDPMADYVTVRRLEGGIQQQALEHWDGKVIKVTSGDSFILRGAGGLCSVRLTGLEVPVATNVFDKVLVERAAKSQQYLASLVLSNEVRVLVTHLPQPPIRSGLGLVYMGTNAVNSAMVAQGHARIRLDFMNGLPREDQYRLLRADRVARRKAGASAASVAVLPSP